jgi:hypothetical protein
MATPNINIVNMTTNTLQDNLDTICNRVEQARKNGDKRELRHFESLKQIYLVELWTREPFKSLATMIALVDSRIDVLVNKI